MTNTEVQKTYFYDARNGKPVAVIEMAHHKWLEAKSKHHILSLRSIFDECVSLNFMNEIKLLRF